MSVRKGEKDTTLFRSERCENINGQWFYRVRETQRLQGPFGSQQEVKKAILDYVEDMKEGKSDANASSHRYLSKVLGQVLNPPGLIGG